jgi:predicted nucleic acid-binding Zn finger protein
MTEQEKRTQKARLALERGQFEIRPLAPGAWRVANGEGGTYTVRRQGAAWACTCPDFTDTCRPNGWTCKHIEGVRLTAAPDPHTEHPMTLNVNQAWTTLTGRPLGEVIQALKAVLPPAAYKPVPGSPGLTDIDPSYLTEKATDLFGPAGLGWFYQYEPRDLEVVALDKTRKNGGGEYTTFEANLLHFSLYFRYLDADGELRLSEPILATGGNTNENRSYAIRGALTNAIGAAFAKLCWQLPVYQGLLDHKNAGQQFAKANGGGQDQGAKGRGANGSNGQNGASSNGLANGKNGHKNPVKPAAVTPAPAGAVCLTFGTKAHPEFKGQALTEVVKSADGRDLVRYLAGPQWAADTDEKRAIKRACEALVPTLPAEAPAPAGQSA